MIRFVLFDLDNTLFDRQSAFKQWATSFAESRGLSSQAVQVLCEADGDGFAPREAVFSVARDRFNLAESTDSLVAEYRRDYIEFVHPDPAVELALRKLRADDFHLGIITNGPSSQHEKIQRLGLAPLVDGVCVSYDFGVAKPDPQIFHEAIRRCCGRVVPPEAGWMVGDSPTYDIAGGHGVGMPTVWLSRGRRWTEPEFDPDLIALSAPHAIEQILLRVQDEQ